MQARGAFALFSNEVQSVLGSLSIREPTPPQQAAIPAIYEGQNVLLASPTGSGKTEAAILPIIDRLVREKRESNLGIKALYISPLRALNRDLLDRLEKVCKQLDIKLSVRHGDTSLQERRVQSLSPPDIMITTPETLQVLLVSRRIRSYLSTLRWVIVDEIHELASDKRGTQLSVCLERLAQVSKEEFQRIGLSATIGNPELLASFLVGVNRSCKVIKVSPSKAFEYTVKYPKQQDEDKRYAEKMLTFPSVASRVRLVASLIKQGPAIVFTNTRSEAEILASRLRLLEPDIRIAVHHGSLSRGSRSKAEESLKSGNLKAIVSTSSLEMGIDVGILNIIVQYGSPRQVTRLVQRAGRSGHTLARVSRCVIVTQDSDDTFEAGVISRFALKEMYEDTELYNKPYDVLVQQLAGLLIERRSWKIEDIYSLIKRAYPYKDLEKIEFERVLDFMQSIRPKIANYREGILSRPFDNKNLYEYYFQNLSMIPETRQYPVVCGDELVGSLDEEFVAKEGDIGKKFILGGSPWKIEQVFEGKVFVRREKDALGAIPTWVGEEIPVPAEVAMEVGRIRGELASMPISSLGKEFEVNKEKRDETGKIAEFAAQYNMDKDSMTLAAKEIIMHKELSIPVPSDKFVTVERAKDLVIIHTHRGLRVNRTVSRLLSAILSVERKIVASEDPYRVILEGKGLTALETADELKNLASKDIEAILKNSSEESGLFRIRFMHVARKMGVLEKDADLTSNLLDKVLQAYKRTVVFDEAWKTFAHEDIDIRGTSRFISDISSGVIKIEVIEGLKEPTPIAMIGLEEMMRKGEVMDPNRLKRLAIESAKARSLGNTISLVCTSCWKYYEDVYPAELKDKPKCPFCASEKLASLEIDTEELDSLMRRMRIGSGLTDRQKKLLRKAKSSAEINQRYGILGIVAQRFDINNDEIRRILDAHASADTSFFAELVESERKNIIKRFIRKAD
ncbi:MAG: DEAD/DEAH box helicase [Conexivisphaerales archaeon]